MTKTTLTRLQEEKIRKVLAKLAETHSIEGQYGIIDFTYDDVVNAADESLNSKAYVSIWLNALEAAGKLTRIRKGSPAHPSRWDVSRFIQSVKAPAKQPVVHVSVAPAVPEVLQAAIKEMINYLKTMSEDMTDYLEDLSKDLRGTGTSSDTRALENKIANFEMDLQVAQKEKEHLRFQLDLKERELQSKPELKVNKAMIIRQHNMIVDEIDRFLGKVPSWSKAGPEHFKAMIMTRLQTMREELGIGGD